MIIIVIRIIAIIAKLLSEILKMNIVIRLEVIIFFKKICEINLVATAMLPLLRIIIITHRIKIEKAL